MTCLARACAARARASTVLRVGALPVLADVDPHTGCITAETVRAALSARTKAVIVVHLACSVADLDGILQITEEAGIPLIEDCAQAHGAQWRGRAVGTFGAMGAFSFQNGKVLTGGESRRDASWELCGSMAQSWQLTARRTATVLGGHAASTSPGTLSRDINGHGSTTTTASRATSNRR